MSHVPPFCSHCAKRLCLGAWQILQGLEDGEAGHEDGFFACALPLIFYQSFAFQQHSPEESEGFLTGVQDEPQLALPSSEQPKVRFSPASSL